MAITPLPNGAQIAQLVEQRIENPRVAGSIPALGTTNTPKINKKILPSQRFSGRFDTFSLRFDNLRRANGLGFVSFKVGEGLNVLPGKDRIT